MKKFIKLLLLVLGFGFIMILGIIIIFEKTLFEKSDTLAYEKISRFYSLNNQDGIVIFGSSRAEGNFIPSLLGENSKTYNYGLPGTGNKMWYYMLLDELDNSISHKVIINIDLQKKPIAVGEDYNYNYYLKLPKNTKLYSSLDIKTKTSLIPYPFYYFGTIKGFISESLKDHISLTAKTDNGFKGNTNSISQVQFDEIINNSEAIQVQFKEELWRNLFNRISESNDEVFFVLTPTFPRYLEKIDFTNFKKNITKLSEKYSNIKFYDFSNSIKNQNLFYDPNHLNYRGAMKFSNILKDSL